MDNRMNKGFCPPALRPALMLQLCNITAACYFNHQLMHTGFCSLSITWIKIKGMICVPIMFCPLTVEHMGNLSVHPTVQDMDLRNMDLD